GAPCTAPASRQTTCCASRPIVVCMRIASVAIAANAGKSRMGGRVALPNVPLERLAQALDDVARALRPRIHQQDAVAREQHLPRHGRLAAADQAHIRDGVVGGATRPRRHQSHHGFDKTRSVCTLWGPKLSGPVQRPSWAMYNSTCASLILWLL